MIASPSRQVLDAIPARVLVFLIGAAKLVPIRLALQPVGYGQDEHDYAWSRLIQLGTFTAVGAPTLDVAVAAAVSELDIYDDKNFPAIKSSLERDYPAQAAFVFENLQVEQGVKSVVAVATLLDRLDALESGAGRAKADHKTDLAALALLAKRGYDEAERTRVASLVTTAKTVVLVEPISDEKRETTLLELYRWHCDWSAQAKRLIKKKAYLIALGLASRKKSPKAALAADPTPGPSPAPQPANDPADAPKPA